MDLRACPICGVTPKLTVEDRPNAAVWRVACTCGQGRAGHALEVWGQSATEATELWNALSVVYDEPKA